jgi:tRNA threonylcarbamoyladenosine biosynthesis protein TsaE
MIKDRENQVLVSRSEIETIAAGEGLSKVLKSGDFTVLTGPLGAGKTCFIKGIAAGLDIPRDDVNSPSYTLVNEYYGRLPLFHLDLYRMKDTSELYFIGWDDYMMRPGIVVVEWGEKAREMLPDSRIEIDIEILGGNIRRLKIDFIEKNGSPPANSSR